MKLVSPLEETIVSLAKQTVAEFNRDVEFIIEQSYGASTIKNAEAWGMTPEIFARCEISDRMNSAYAYIELARINDSGLSPGAADALLELERDMIRTASKVYH